MAIAKNTTSIMEIKRRLAVMKRLISEMLFLSCLFGGIHFYGKYQYKKGWKDNGSVSKIMSKFSDTLKKSKNEEES